MNTTAEMLKRILEDIISLCRLHRKLATDWTQETADSAVAKYGEIADMITVMGKRIVDLEGGK